MTKRRLFWLAYAACLGLAVFWGVRLLTHRHRINRESFEKLQVGMSVAEVEAILGVPAGDYATGLYVEVGLRKSFSIHDTLASRWVGDDGVIRVWLNEGGKVLSCRWDNIWLANDEETIVCKFRRWLGISSVDSDPMPYDW
jgi:hypothetical protein